MTNTRQIIHRNEAAAILTQNLGATPLISTETHDEFTRKATGQPLPGKTDPTSLQQSWVFDPTSGDCFRPDGAFFRLKMIEDPRYPRVENFIVEQNQKLVEVNGTKYQTVGVVCPLVHKDTNGELKVLVQEQSVPATNFQTKVFFCTRAGVDNPTFAQTVLNTGGSIHIVFNGSEPDINRMASPQLLAVAFVTSLQGLNYNALMTIDDFMFNPRSVDSSGKLAISLAERKQLGFFA